MLAPKLWTFAFAAGAAAESGANQLAGGGWRGSHLCSGLAGCPAFGDGPDQASFVQSTLLLVTQRAASPCAQGPAATQAADGGLLQVDSASHGVVVSGGIAGSATQWYLFPYIFAWTNWSPITCAMFTQSLVTVLWEVSAMIIMARFFCLRQDAALAITLVALSLPLCGGSLAMNFRRRLSDVQLLRLIQAVQLCMVPFFIVVGLFIMPVLVALAIFLVASCILFMANSSSTGTNLVMSTELALPDSRYLGKDALCVYSFCALLGAYFLAPILAFAVNLQVYPNPYQLAIMLLFPLLLQVPVDLCAARVREDHHSKEPVPAG